MWLWTLMVTFILVVVVVVERGLQATQVDVDS